MVIYDLKIELFNRTEKIGLENTATCKKLKYLNTSRKFLFFYSILIVKMHNIPKHALKHRVENHFALTQELISMVFLASVLESTDIHWRRK